MDFVDRIDLKLKERNLKRASLCEEVNITHSALTDWKKRGTIPSADVCFRIAEYLEVSAEWLVTGKDKPAPKYSGVYDERIADLKEEQKKAIDTLLGFYESENAKEFSKDLF